MYLLTDHGCYYTSNFSGPAGGDPTWTLIDGGLPASPTYRWLQPDPYRTGTRQYMLINGADAELYGSLYVRTGGNWSKLIDADQLAALEYATYGGRYSPLHGSASPLKIDSFQTDINADGYIGVFAHFFGQALALAWTYYVYVYFYSTDFGVTWHIMPWQASPFVMPKSDLALESTVRESQIGDYAGASGYGGGQVLYMPLARPANLYNHLYRSVDKGLHWSLVSDNAFNFSLAMFNTDVYQNVLYSLGATNGLATRFLKRSSNNGVAWSADLLDAGIAIASASSPSIYRLHALFNPTGSYSSILRVTDDNCDVWKSTDSGATWTQYTHDATATGHMHNLGISLCHDSDGKLYGFSLGSVDDSDRAIWCSADEGVTWTAKAGANPGAAPYTNSIPGHAVAICIAQII